MHDTRDLAKRLAELLSRERRALDGGQRAGAALSPGASRPVRATYSV
jgi:hypothetical protein